MTWILFPGRKQYKEVPGAAGGVAAFLPRPGRNPCAGMEKVVTCTRLGIEVVNGRSAEKWRLIWSSGGVPITRHQWVDRELGITLRSEPAERQWLELRNLRIGPQPAALFAIPKGFTRVSP